MRLFLVIGEDRFYHPDFLREFLILNKDEIVGAILVVKAPKKADLQGYLLNNFYLLSVLEIFKLSLKVFSSFRKKNSVEKVFVEKDIDYIKVSYNINTDEVIRYVKGKQPDVIISSNPCIFKEELLSLPSICCINRHSSLLPSFKGLWPVFWAYLNGEMYVGTTVHTMVKEIDKGIILAQEKVPIEEKDTVFTLYKKTFLLSPDLIIKALDKIRCNDLTSVNNTSLDSYYSFPKTIDWYRFRKKGGRFI